MVQFTCFWVYCAISFLAPGELVFSLLKDWCVKNDVCLGGLGVCVCVMWMLPNFHTELMNTFCNLSYCPLSFHPCHYFAAVANPSFTWLAKWKTRNIVSRESKAFQKMMAWKIHTKLCLWGVELRLVSDELCSLDESELMQDLES